MPESAIGVDRVGQQLDDTHWDDVDGLVGYFPPGHGARANPVGEFPSGPPVGSVLPEVVATSHTGDVIDLHRFRAGQPAVVVFYRSAVW